MVVGLLTIGMAVALLLLFADQVLRLIVVLFSRLFLTIRVRGRGRIVQKEAMLLIAPKISWLDTWIMLATLPRMIYYVVPIRKERQQLSFLL